MARGPLLSEKRLVAVWAGPSADEKQLQLLLQRSRRVGAVAGLLCVSACRFGASEEKSPHADGEPQKTKVASRCKD